MPTLDLGPRVPVMPAGGSRSVARGSSTVAMRAGSAPRPRPLPPFRAGDVPPAPLLIRPGVRTVGHDHCELRFLVTVPACPGRDMGPGPVVAALVVLGDLTV